MNRSSMIPGLLFIVAGALLALVPHVLLPVCGHGVPTASGGSVPMKCFWTARAELGAGMLMVFTGLAYCLCRNAAARFGLTVAAAATALLAMAFPTLLIGVCRGETMACRMGTQPGIFLAGAAAFAVAAVAAWRLRPALKQRDPEQ